MVDFIKAFAFYKLIDDSSLQSLKRELYIAAIRYAHIRAEWSRKSNEEKLETDKERTAAHNRFIDACNIFSRNQANVGENNLWINDLIGNRKVFGDFACYIHLFQGLKNR